MVVVLALVRVPDSASWSEVPLVVTAEVSSPAEVEARLPMAWGEARENQRRRDQEEEVVGEEGVWLVVVLPPAGGGAPTAVAVVPPVAVAVPGETGGEGQLGLVTRSPREKDILLLVPAPAPAAAAATPAAADRFEEEEAAEAPGMGIAVLGLRFPPVSVGLMMLSLARVLAPAVVSPRAASASSDWPRCWG